MCSILFTGTQLGKCGAGNRHDPGHLLCDGSVIGQVDVPALLLVVLLIHCAHSRV